MLGIIDIGGMEYSELPQIALLKTIPGYPGEEFKYLPKFMALFITVIRISTGDFNFDESKQLDEFLNWIYWIIWFIIVIVTFIVYMNFIIAEVSNSYQIIRDSVDAIIQ
jgi:hypothetical protein